MSIFEIFALVWIPVAVAIVIGFAFFLGWLEDRAEPGTRLNKGSPAGNVFLDSVTLLWKWHGWRRLEFSGF